MTQKKQFEYNISMDGLLMIHAHETQWTHLHHLCVLTHTRVILVVFNRECTVFTNTFVFPMIINQDDRNDKSDGRLECRKIFARLLIRLFLVSNANRLNPTIVSSSKR